MQTVRIALLGVLLLALSAPVDLMAQGQGKGQENKAHKQKSHVVARGHDRDHDDDRDDDDDRKRPIKRDEQVIRRAPDGRVSVRNRSIRDRDGWIVLGRRDREDDDRIVLRDRRGRVIVIGDDDIDERFNRRQGNGPPFCRSGAGHPVHGRRWCLEKGWGLGDRNDIFFDDDRIIFWDDGDPVIVRDRRLRERSVWERVLGTILFWTD